MAFGVSGQEYNGLNRADRRLLQRLNLGIGVGEPPPRLQVDRLVGSGLVHVGPSGELFITSQGQLALARWRFRNIPKPRRVVLARRPRPSIWDKLFS